MSAYLRTNRQSLEGEMPTVKYLYEWGSAPRSNPELERRDDGNECTWKTPNSRTPVNGKLPFSVEASTRSLVVLTWLPRVLDSGWVVREPFALSMSWRRSFEVFNALPLPQMVLHGDIIHTSHFRRSADCQFNRVSDSVSNCSGTGTTNFASLTGFILPTSAWQICQPYRCRNVMYCTDLLLTTLNGGTFLVLFSGAIVSTFKHSSKT